MMIQKQPVAVTSKSGPARKQILKGKKSPNPGGNRDPVAENAAGKLRPSSVSD